MSAAAAATASPGATVRVAIVPGNGTGSVRNCNFYGWLQAKLSAASKQQQHGGALEVALQDMPDPLYAKEKIWLPFMKQTLRCGPDTIIVGHSSGAAAAMRFAESERVGGLVLVSAYTSDLGDELEAGSGYFSRPWGWDAIRANVGAGGIAQFGSSDDPFLPWSEQQAVADALKAELHKYDDRGHFQNTEQPDILKVVLDKVALLQQQQQQQQQQQIQGGGGGDDQ